jgi:hypothetical protein
MHVGRYCLSRYSCPKKRYDGPMEPSGYFSCRLSTVREQKDEHTYAEHPLLCDDVCFSAEAV